MKRSSSSRMTSILGIYAIIVITAIVLTACVRVGEDTNPNAPKVQQPAPVSDASNIKDSSTKKDSSSTQQAKSETQNSASQSAENDNRRQPRYDEPTQVSTFQTTGDGYIWYNNETFNYTLKFPEWMSKKIGPDENIILTGSESKNSSADNFTVNVRFIEMPDNIDSESWFNKLEAKEDQKVSYKGYSFKLEAVADTEGPYVRRAYVPLAERGALELTFTYSTTSETLNSAFEKKATEGYYTVINSASELYMSN